MNFSFLDVKKFIDIIASGRENDVSFKGELDLHHFNRLLDSIPVKQKARFYEHLNQFFHHFFVVKRFEMTVKPAALQAQAMATKTTLSGNQIQARTLARTCELINSKLHFDCRQGQSSSISKDVIHHGMKQMIVAAASVELEASNFKAMWMWLSLTSLLPKSSPQQRMSSNDRAFLEADAAFEQVLIKSL